MTTTRARSPRIRASWHQPTGPVPRVTLARIVRGVPVERTVGPRGLLTLEEAAAVLDRPIREVRKDIRTAFLPARRHEGRLVVTVAACYRFLVEEREDGQGACAALEEMRRTGQRPIPYERVRQEAGLE